jgi:Escherichia/Staphylococcus phage prohead protease
MTTQIVTLMNQALMHRKNEAIEGEPYVADYRATIPNYEVRFAATEVRVEPDESPRLTGYAARFMSLSVDLGGFKERILPGAFKRSLESSEIDVLALAQHDIRKPMGRRSRGTLKLVEDGYGLRFDLSPANTTWTRDAIEGVSHGDLVGMSFGFVVRQDTLIQEGEEWIRELRDVDLYEISVVTDPAYPATSVNIRSSVLAEINRLRVPPVSLLMARQKLAELQ